MHTARSMETAPRDSTMLRLLVSFTEHATDDADEAWTIGFNEFDNTGEDEWKFAGWCWNHDHFTEGKGTPIGWLPMFDESQAEALEPTGLPKLPSPVVQHALLGPLFDRLQMQFYAAKGMRILEDEVERLRGIKPELPPFPPGGSGLPRYGLRWNGPTEPLAVPMDDGYWTPWHLAAACNA